MLNINSLPKDLATHGFSNYIDIWKTLNTKGKAILVKELNAEYSKRKYMVIMPRRSFEDYRDGSKFFMDALNKDELTFDRLAKSPYYDKFHGHLTYLYRATELEEDKRLLVAIDNWVKVNRFKGLPKVEPKPIRPKGVRVIPISQDMTREYLEKEHLTKKFVDVFNANVENLNKASRKCVKLAADGEDASWMRPSLNAFKNSLDTIYKNYTASSKAVNDYLESLDS